MNQNLLIVDDEYDILSWLEELFRYDFDMELGVYTAESAYEALELLNQIKFDVVLTDIRMPGMDGITLFHQIKRNWPRCKVVFLTGYRNFDDLYQIAQNKDVRFLLKTEEDDAIQRAVRESLIELQKELEAEALDTLRNEQLERAKYWFRKEFLDRFLSGEMPSAQKFREDVKKYEIPISFSAKFLAFLIRTEPSDDNAIPNQIETLEGLERILKKNLPGNITLFLYVIDAGQALGLVQASDAEEWQRIFAVLQGALEYSQIIFRSTYGSCFSAAVESTPIGTEDLPEMYARLRQVMVGYLGGAREVIAHIESLEVAERREHSLSKGINAVHLLKDYLELGRRKEYFEVLSECTAELTKAKSRHDLGATELYYSISVLLLQYVNENQMNEKLAFETGLYKLTKVDEHASWRDAVQYLFEVSNAIFKLSGSNENVLSDRALKRVSDYIDSHLSEDLSLTRLAGIGGFNASYLSRLFKQTYNENITDYIYRRRMDLAKRLLADTNQKIQDIAVKSGYTSAHSFARTFRASSGLSPIEYRELHRKE